jgi:GntR family transcriptional regulator
VDAALTTVDPSVITPLYLQVARFIAEQASGGGLTRGAKLPTERTLCAQFGVSRVTLRRALAVLVDEGVLESSAGRGWFVTTGVLGEPPNALRSFTETARIRGLTAGARVLRAASEPASLDESDSFKIAPGSPVFRLRRVRLLDGVPVACDESRVPLGFAPALVDADFTVASLYRELEIAGNAPVRAEYAIEAAGAEADVAEQLDLEPGAPVLVAQQTGFGPDDRVIELSSTVYRADRYRFRAALHRPFFQKESS